MPLEQHHIALVVLHEVYGGVSAPHVTGHEDALLNQDPGVRHILETPKVAPELGGRLGSGEVIDHQPRAFTLVFMFVTLEHFLCNALPTNE